MKWTSFDPKGNHMKAAGNGQSISCKSTNDGKFALHYSRTVELLDLKVYSPKADIMMFGILSPDFELGLYDGLTIGRWSQFMDVLDGLEKRAIGQVTGQTRKKVEDVRNFLKWNVTFRSVGCYSSPCTEHAPQGQPSSLRRKTDSVCCRYLSSLARLHSLSQAGF